MRKRSALACREGLKEILAFPAPVGRTCLDSRSGVVLKFGVGNGKMRVKIIREEKDGHQISGGARAAGSHAATGVGAGHTSPNNIPYQSPNSGPQPSFFKFEVPRSPSHSHSGSCPTIVADSTPQRAQFSSALGAFARVVRFSEPGYSSMATWYGAGPQTRLRASHVSVGRDSAPRMPHPFDAIYS